MKFSMSRAVVHNNVGELPPPPRRRKRGRKPLRSRVVRTTCMLYLYGVRVLQVLVSNISFGAPFPSATWSGLGDGGSIYALSLVGIGPNALGPKALIGREGACQSLLVVVHSSGSPLPPGSFPPPTASGSCLCLCALEATRPHHMHHAFAQQNYRKRT